MDKSLLNKFFLNECTDSERKTIVSWLIDPQNDQLAKDWMKDNWNLICSIDVKNYPNDPDFGQLWLSVQNKIKQSGSAQMIAVPARISFFKRYKHIAIAASILTFIAIGAIYFATKNTVAVKNLSQAEKSHNNIEQDIAPPHQNNAVITLADGTMINLDSTNNGKLATQGNVKVLKTVDGKIIYAGMGSDVITYNTLTVPKGSKPVQLVLADGSLVWLNSASAITYPTAFAGKERKVSITGEGYFEIAKNAAMPFYVVNKKLTVKVLGTHFNVNTYDDESDGRVTLLEGAVNITNGVNEKSLRSGQQARVAPHAITTFVDVDIDEVMAWKNEQFYFSGTDIKTIMRQLEKYYNIEVEYEDDIKYQFVAKISRQVNISELLNKFELTNLIHFKIEGNKVIISK